MVVDGSRRPPRLADSAERRCKVNCPNEYVTLSGAAKVAPGRPSANCMWRWCRKGVRSRGGEIVRLEHIRLGGKILTTADWVADFARRLAEADTAYFDRRAEMAQPPAPAASPSASRDRSSRRHGRIDAIERSRRIAKEAGS